MEKISIRNELGKCYLIVKCQENLEKEYLLSMITENSIRGLLFCKIVYEDSNRMLYFDVTNMISLEREYSSKNISVDDLDDIFGNISSIYKEGQKYLLDEKYYIIDPEFIFINPVNNEYNLLYLPGSKSNYESNNYDKLADFLLQKVEQRNQVAVNLTYMFYKMIKVNTFCLESFIEIIDKEKIVAESKKEVNEVIEEKYMDEIEYSAKEEIKEEGLGKTLICFAVSLVFVAIYLFIRNSLYATYVLILAILLALLTVICLIKYIVNYLQIRNEEELEYCMQNASADDYWNNDETVVFDDRTVVFSEEKGNLEKEHIISWKEKGIQKKYKITKYPVTIGKMKSEVDCCILDQSVSRIHAKIDKQNGKLFIKDMNSTNGTEVDGEKIAVGELMEIGEETSILLGNMSIRIV